MAKYDEDYLFFFDQVFPETATNEEVYSTNCRISVFIP